MRCGSQKLRFFACRQRDREQVLSYAGFTLIELAVVLVIIGLITSMGIAVGIDALESTRRVATETKMNAVEEALGSFRTRYGRLPCPASATLATTDTNYGIEAANNNGTCTGGTPAATYLTTTGTSGVPSGAIPARTLGLPDEFMLDGWGKKLTYEVTPSMTRDNAFLYSQVFDSCSITVRDHSDTALGTGAVYALISHGKNGVGAYVAGGTQFTGATAGTAEQTNIRGASYTTSPTIRLKNGVSGAEGSTGYYDDIVRFKQRYQMMDVNDRSSSYYKGPEMILSHNATSGVQLVYGKPTCSAWQPVSLTMPALPAAAPKFIGLTPGNTNAVVYFTNDCNLYSISSTTFTALTDFTTCPADATTGAMAKTSGTLVLNQTASPYVRVYKMSGSGSTAAYTESTSALSPTASYAPTNITLSASGEYLTISKASSVPALYTQEADGSYQAVAAASVPGNAYTEYSTAISPDSKYYALTVVSGGNTQLFMYRNIGGAFSQMGDAASGTPYLLATITGMTTPEILTFSPDSTYLAVGGGSTANNFAVFYINPVTEAVSSALGVTLSVTPVGIAFSKDSTFVGVARASTSTNSMSIYRKASTTSYNSTAETLGSSFSFNGSSASNFIAFSR